MGSRRVRKNYALNPDQFKPLTNKPGYCLASVRITVNGRLVGFMYRERGRDERDSGWRFFAGDESDEFTANPANFELYAINTIANYDSSIIPLLDAAPGSAFIRKTATSDLERDDQWQPPE
jgi:hypothetical protein